MIVFKGSFVLLNQETQTTIQLLLRVHVQLVPLNFLETLILFVILLYVYNILYFFHATFVLCE